jgi:HSP20 family protein
MSLVRYTSYPISNLQQQINRMFEDFQPAGGPFEGLGGGTFAPALDVKENAESYIVSLEVPGIAQDDLNISLENNVLTVRGQKQQKREENEGAAGESVHRVERSYGSFARSVTLPRSVESGKVSASLNDGVLRIELPKEEQAKPRQITIGATHES